MIEHNSEKDRDQILNVKAEILAAIENQQRQRQPSDQTENAAATFASLTMSASRTMSAVVLNQTQDWHAAASGSISSQSSINYDPGLDLELDREVARSFVLDKDGGKASKILKSLRFPDMRLRHDTIEEAHHKTFEWIFSKNSSPFREWLSNDGGIFWVNGKAGSGKSTLMKYLADHQQTRNLLEGWAGKSSPLIFADFFFWYLGTGLQKSEEGLLRSLLFQILLAVPELIPKASTTRWKDSIEIESSWSLQELRQAFEHIISNEIHAHRSRLKPKSSQSKAREPKACKFCFFIDGLDEYHADQVRLVELIQALSTKLSIKICVSSRPWNVFDQAFGQLREQLVLETLTKSDIALYIEHELRQRSLDNAEFKTLVKEISAKAQGVFLWVFLTVRTLKEGLAEGDTLRLLRERVALLPSELVDYFQVILSRVHPVYKKSKTMTALHIAVSATRQDLRAGTSPTALTRSFLNFWILRQGMEEPTSAIAQPILDCNQGTYMQMARRTRAFLSATCKDLLQLPLPQYATDDLKAEFLHRTVYEFLDSDEMRPKIEGGTLPHVRQIHFNVTMALLRLKLVNDSIRFHERAFALIREAVNHQINPADTIGQSLLAELDRVASISVEKLSEVFAQFDVDSLLPLLDALSERGQYALTTEILKSPMSLRSETCSQSVLMGALGLKYGQSFRPEYFSKAFLEYLLSYKMDINTRPKSTESSVWEQFLHEGVAWTRNAGFLENAVGQERIWEVTKILLDHGANTREYLTNGWTTEEALQYIVPAEHHDELRRLLVDRAK